MIYRHSAYMKTQSALPVVDEPELPLRLKIAIGKIWNAFSAADTSGVDGIGDIFGRQPDHA